MVTKNTPKNAHPNPVAPLPTTIKIPGGTATFYRESELPVRREREVSLVGSQMNLRKLQAIKNASVVQLDDDVSVDARPDLTGPSVTLTADEARVIYLLTDTAIWAYLRSWSLKVNGEPRPLPETVDAVLDLPPNIYAALESHASKILARAQAEGDTFSVEAVEDEESPTEPSDA